jgi:hypothetical protein
MVGSSTVRQHTTMLQVLRMLSYLRCHCCCLGAATLQHSVQEQTAYDAASIAYQLPVGEVDECSQLHIKVNSSSNSSSK